MKRVKRHSGTIERTEPMRVHKRIVILWLEAHPEDEEQIVPEEWRGRLPEYLDALRKAPGEWFVNGTLEEKEG